MLDAFAKVVAQADARGEFLSNTQLDALSSMVAEGNKRLDVVNKINSNASAIVTNSARALFAEQPQLIQPGGNAYTSRRMAACLRDMEIVLRYVSYAMIAGDSSVLDDRCLNGLRETYQALGTPGSSVSVAVQKMKEASVALANDLTGTPQGDCSALVAELGSYFDRAAVSVV
ncbi:phycocyanin beta subunit (chloroplast) [Porphyra umbilicalis]|uniref:Phycocyanin beta subunit n=8 Tax=Bangiaceae TaxID=31345 RepID=J7F7L9_PORUM|nr:phycocyanin beta subunit [Neoporphyra haitanensis]YP_009027661.1 phycocyanin, beta chain [Neoporphyra perforata]YP_009237475.1 phycocyanin, beta chain [Wildemania schizophylla]YP_009244688.1 phycocyanin beta subunit [Pyropia pulchra]YP_009413388.1 phycocyanin beta subunit [Porphyra umbilicalis]YP_010338240.1 phycocyanin beta subunit [Bangia atropurpurea]YP_010925695.1 phycocyanin beta subunit [Neoporphyra dentata]YP_010925906.1 phycocyanin beta subunit [Neoporphyra seriata]AKE98976.1 phy|eukprot:ASN78849.1 phycocyanin beta subunit (chloroplast) [Porphyra umbilicalis]